MEGESKQMLSGAPSDHEICTGNEEIDIICAKSGDRPKPKPN
jgi:hypothetical protein